MIIQAFIIAEGSGAARAELVKAFYDRAGEGAEPGAFPDVQPEVMTSLVERGIVGLDRAEAFVEAVVRTLREIRPEPADSEMTHRIHFPEAASIEIMCRQLSERYPLPR